MENNDNRTKKYGRIIFYSAFAIIITVLIVLNVRDEKEREYVLKSYDKTIGEIKEVNSIGVERKTFLTYTYTVGYRKYERTVKVSSELQGCCDLQTNPCCLARYWVIYSKDKPEKSLINLSMDLQSESNPTFPKSLEYFR